MEMSNEERMKFLAEKPRYHCRFHPTDWFHEVGCSDKKWTVEELQGALDNAKRANELQFELSKHLPKDLLKNWI